MKTAKFVSSYVKASDIKSPTTVTVRTAEAVTFKDKTKPSLVLYTAELEQGIVLNKTSIGQLTEIFKSEDTDEWIGKRAVLFNDPSVLYAGKRVGGLRFRAN